MREMIEPSQTTSVPSRSYSASSTGLFTCSHVHLPGYVTTASPEDLVRVQQHRQGVLRIPVDAGPDPRDHRGVERVHVHDPRTPGGGRRQPVRTPVRRRLPAHELREVGRDAVAGPAQRVVPRRQVEIRQVSIVSTTYRSVLYTVTAPGPDMSMRLSVAALTVRRMCGSASDAISTPKPA